MSTVKANAIIDASGGNTATINSMTPTADSLQGFRNRIINGDMGIAQRSVGPVTNATANSNLIYETLDRWGYWAEASGKFSVQQSSTAPTGFSTSALITSSTALSVASGSYYTFSQRIEGFNFADLGFGTANAKSFTVSFWVRSSITGTFPFYCFNTGETRSYVSTFTINAVNTWEQKTITVAGDTSGTWVGATNGEGIEVGITLAAGSTWFSPSANTWSSAFYALGLSGATNFLATNGATLNITGVQLEVGSVATPFERIDYGRELAMCQRYYYLHASGSAKNIGVGVYFSTTNLQANISFPVSMRSAPTSAIVSGTNYYIFFRDGASDEVNSFLLEAATTNTTNIYNPFEASGTAGQAGVIYTNNASAFLAFQAEL
jgi:hypothetical protein